MKGADMEGKKMIYEMELIFSVTAGLKDINELNRQLNMPTMYVQNAKVVCVKMTVPFIPDDKVIALYEETIKNGFNSGKSLEIKSVKFEGFKYLRELGEKDMADFKPSSACSFLPEPENC